MSYLKQFESKKKTIKDSLEYISQSLAKTKEGNPQVLEIKERFEPFSELIKNRLNEVLPALVNPIVLDNLIQQLGAMIKHINQFLSVPNTPLHAQATEALYNAIGYVNHIPKLDKEEIQQSLSQITNTFEKRNNQILEQVQNQIKGCNNILDEIKNDVSNLKTSLSQKNTEITSLTSKFQEQFSVAQEKRINEFEVFMKKIEADQQEKNKIIEDKAQNLVDSMEKHVEQSRKLLGIVGKNSFAGHHKQYADQARKKANIYSWSALGLMILFAICIAYTLLSLNYQTNKINIDILYFLKEILFRTSIFSVLLLPAFYLANEAQKQREKEFKYRDFEIKISASEPYIASISDKIAENNSNATLYPKDQLKVDLTKTFFGDMYREDKESNIVIPKDTLQFIEKILSTLVKIKK